MKKLVCILMAIISMLLVSCQVKCEHSWKDATCQSPSTCLFCGKVQGEIGQHNYNDATCIAPKTCTVCGKTEGVTLATHTYIDDKCKDCGCIQLTKWNFEDYLDFSVFTSYNNEYSLTCIAKSVGNPHYKYNDVKIIVKCVSYYNTEDYGKAMLLGEEVIYYDETEITLFLNLAGNDSGESLLWVKKSNLISYSIEGVSGTVQEY